MNLTPEERRMLLICLNIVDLMSETNIPEQDLSTEAALDKFRDEFQDLESKVDVEALRRKL